ncbi:MAG: RlmE family RNA methyltransferase [Gammaproteobacteria bacterium]
MKKGKVDRTWIAQHINDPYVKLAQKHQYRSRAAFKLIEIAEQDRLIRPGITVVDLGSAPGAWSQVLRERLARPAGQGGGLDGRVVALDMLPMEPVEGVEFLQGDFREEETLRGLQELLGDRAVDLVVSDMAPNLSGVAVADSARMADLVELAIEFAQEKLQPGGALLVKCFHGSGYSQLVERFRQVFVTVAPRKPKASRGRSAETYLLGRSLKAVGQRKQ